MFCYDLWGFFIQQGEMEQSTWIPVSQELFLGFV